MQAPDVPVILKPKTISRKDTVSCPAPPPDLTANRRPDFRSCGHNIYTGFPSLYVRTDPYGVYGTRRIYMRVLAFMWPKYTRTPIDRPYSSDRKRVISYGLPTGYRSVRLSKPHEETEGLRYIYTAPHVQKTAA